MFYANSLIIIMSQPSRHIRNLLPQHPPQYPVSISWQNFLIFKGSFWEPKRSSLEGGYGHSERPERGGPFWLLKVRQIGSQGVHMKGVFPWLVCWARRARTRYFVMPWLRLSSSHRTLFHFICPHRPASLAGSRAASPVSNILICVSGGIILDYRLLLCLTGRP
jgi:hypothetical protein